MKIRRLSLIVLAIVTGPWALSAPPDNVSGRFYRRPAVEIIDAYGKLSQKQVRVPSEITSSNTEVSVEFENKPREEAMRIIEDALLKLASIEIVHEKDGSISARRVVAKKEPNQSSQPTPPPVTSPAEQEPRQP